ncbi:MAG: hypothetical protein PVJ57_20305 [Phycisphaerae bacterium]|jgi:hypothetical protein
MKRSWFPVAVFLAVLIGGVASVSADDYDVYARALSGDPVPDVNKDPFPPVEGDRSCWQAAAANMLAAGGWGLPEMTAQEAANSIYGHMTGHFGKNHGGFPEVAMTWWLYNYGCNPMAVGGWYQPEMTYNDVFGFYWDLRFPVRAAYEYSLGALQEGRYAAVTWTLARQMDSLHTMTFVGGNRPDGGRAPVSVWHDSDVNAVAPGDDQYPNAFAGGSGNWTLPGVAEGPVSYAELSAGAVRDPEWLTATTVYTAVYYRDLIGPFTTVPLWRPRVDGLTDPTWQQDAAQKWKILDLPSIGEPAPDDQLDLYLFIDLLDRPEWSEENPLPVIQFDDGLGGLWAPEVTQSGTESGQLLYHWCLGNVPATKRLRFPEENYCNLTFGIWSLDISYQYRAVPEPGALAGLVLAAVVVLRRVR